MPGSGCTTCGQPGVSYEYKGQQFDGLCAYHGDRLCPACRDARMAVEGVNILVVDDRPSIPPYVWNTVRDRDLVQIYLPPELRGQDGRDMPGPLAARRKARREAIRRRTVKLSDPPAIQGRHDIGEDNDTAS